MYEIPNSGMLDGITLSKNSQRIMFRPGRIDDTRLQRDDHILVATYPRTGTTWLTQTVNLIVRAQDGNDVTDDNVFRFVPFLERSLDADGRAGIEKLHTYPTPVVCKTHLPYRFVRRWVDEDRVKTIVTTRNPKDTLVSRYHFYKDMEPFQFSGTWDDFFAHVQAGKLLFGDPYDFWRDWSTTHSQANVLFVSYEDMKGDITREIHRILAFLGLTLSNDRLRQLLRNVSFSEMKKMATRTLSRGNFVRKGETGGWRNYFTVQQNEWFDATYKHLYEALPFDVHYE